VTAISLYFLFNQNLEMIFSTILWMIFRLG